MREALRAWDGLTVAGPVSGGHRNHVVAVRRGRERLVARRSWRGPDSLEWEIGLLGHLARQGIRVPAIVPARDGRHHVDGVVVQTWLDGAPPREQDWPRVLAVLRRLHEVTSPWAQRPDFASTSDLLTITRGGDVDLAVMPAEAVTVCRQAWAELGDVPRAVVHGDPGPSNIRVDEHGAVGLLDWDEARVDHADLDLADLPVRALPATRQLPACRAVRAWEAAASWQLEPAYARQQLARLVAGSGAR